MSSREETASFLMTKNREIALQLSNKHRAGERYQSQQDQIHHEIPRAISYSITNGSTVWIRAGI
jgi:hypothetical protein